MRNHVCGSITNVLSVNLDIFVGTGINTSVVSVVVFIFDIEGSIINAVSVTDLTDTTEPELQSNNSSM